MILGTEGYIELRKYVDVAGRAGQDHLFVVDAAGTEYIDCSDVELSYYPDPGARRDQPHRDSLPAKTHLRGNAAGNPGAAERDDDGVPRVNGSGGQRNAPCRDRRMRRDRMPLATRTTHASSWSASSTSTQHAPVRLPRATTQRRTAPAATSLINCLTWSRTPPGNHREVAVELLESGCSVLLEKPPTTTLADMDVLADAEKLSSGSVYVVFSTVMDQARVAPTICCSRALGTPRVAVCETLWYRPDDYFLPEWRGNWVGEGGGPTLGHGIHQIDLLLHLLGPWETVDGRAARIARPVEFEDVSLAILTFSSGAVGTVVTSLLSPKS